MRLLLDTCVLSDAVHPRGEQKVKAWLSRQRSEELFVSVLVLGEIAAGIARLPMGGRRAQLEAWQQRLTVEFADRILPIDLEIGRLWGEMNARCGTQGLTLPPIDGLIAATAMARNLCIATRNTRHFAQTGAQLINPWEDGA